jgi:hypothetical protein
MTSGAGERSRIVEMAATAAYGGRSGGGDGGAAAGRSRLAAASGTGHVAAAGTGVWRRRPCGGGGDWACSSGLLGVRRWRPFWWCRELGDEEAGVMC